MFCPVQFRFFVVLLTLSIAGRVSLADETGFSIKQNINHVTVLVSGKPFATTNLTAKVMFNRVILEGGKLADTSKQVVVTPATKP